jgi:hypothetical protein
MQSDELKFEKGAEANGGSKPKDLTVETSPSRLRLMTEDDTEVGSVMSSRAESPAIVCSTTVTSVVAGCLSRGTGERPPSDTDEEDEDNDVPFSDKYHTESVNDLKRNDSLLQQKVVFDPEKVEEKYQVDPKQLFAQDSKLLRSARGQEEESRADDEKEEDFHISEEEMVLCLGNGGRIGTLDVRLIGKELHVMVEDAFLIVEACPKPEELEDSSVRTASTADTTKEDTSKAKKNDKKKPTKPPGKIAETVGERVMEKSVIARAISAIPHLFLRDIRVQLIVRNRTQDGESRTEVGPDDSLIEVGIEMLSVTSGEDFLEHLRSDDAAGNEADESTNSHASRQRVSLKTLEERDENEYMNKRIRTGKGPEGGITVKILPPRRYKRFDTEIGELQTWAVQSFRSRAHFCVFRCTGLDIRTRIFLGKQKEIALRNNDYAWYGDEYDEYTIDSMLYGVDYIAPAPPPLPPLKKSHKAPIETKIVKPEVECFTTDENGIQSNKIRSCFHKVARGLIPTLCQKDHLPSENCPYCWKDGSRPNSYTEHPFDSRTPLPGVVFNLALDEPMEINIDRKSLEVIGSLNELFTRQTSEEPAVQEIEEADENVSKPKKTSITQKLKDMTFGKKEKREILKSAFPSYMKPETIEIAGVFISKIVFRIHVMKEESYDSGLTFRYWEATIECGTVDIQMHNSKERSFQDIRCDVGYFETNEYRGVETKQMAIIGLAPARGKDEDSTAADVTGSPRKATGTIVCWPTTAATMLQVPALAEMTQFESREKHCLQVRFFSLENGDSDLSMSTMNARVGMFVVDLPDTFPSEVFSIINQAQNSIFGQKVNRESGDKGNVSEAHKAGLSPKVAREYPRQPRLMYAIRLDGGTVAWSPLVQIRLPILRLSGEQASDSQLFFETILNHVKVQYGKRSSLEMPQNQLSLSTMARLPDEVRLRILLFLNDLGPLEKALGVKRASNSFLRCCAVNKAIVKVAKRSPSPTKMIKRKRSSRQPSTDSKPSRQEILSELMKLDEQALEDLWFAHKTRPKPRPVTRNRTYSDK